MFKKRLSQIMWAIRKWYVVDTLNGWFPITQELGAVALADIDIVKAATALIATTKLVTTGITSPAAYRNLTITWNAVWIAWNVVIKWTDWAGRSISETIVASGTDTVAWVKAFKTVTSILLPALTTAWDTISIGTGASMGLYRDISAAGDVKSVYVDWVREAVASVDAANGTITVTTAFNWVKYVTVSYLVTTF